MTSLPQFPAHVVTGACFPGLFARRAPRMACFVGVRITCPLRRPRRVVPRRSGWARPRARRRQGARSHVAEPARSASRRGGGHALDGRACGSARACRPNASRRCLRLSGGKSLCRRFESFRDHRADSRNRVVACPAPQPITGSDGIGLGLSSQPESLRSTNFHHGLGLSTGLASMQPCARRHER